MPEHSLTAPLTALTPLFSETPAQRRIGDVQIIERVDIALASLAERAGGGAELARRATKAGLPLPGPEGHAAGPELSAFWIGPGLWMVEAPLDSHEDIVAAIAPWVGDAAAVTEQTDGWARFVVTTDRPATLLERLCNIDPARLQSGAALRSTIEHMAVFVVIPEPGAELHLLTPRSTATDFLHALETAAQSITGNFDESHSYLSAPV